MRTFIRRAPALLVLLLLPACADLSARLASVNGGQWQREGASADDIALTRQECRSAVLGQLRSHLQLSRRETEAPARSAAGPAAWLAGGSAIDRRQREVREARQADRLMQACMRARGYRRVEPGEQAA